VAAGAAPEESPLTKQRWSKEKPHNYTNELSLAFGFFSLIGLFCKEGSPGDQGNGQISEASSRSAMREAQREAKKKAKVEASSTSSSSRKSPPLGALGPGSNREGFHHAELLVQGDVMNAQLRKAPG